MKEFPAGLEIDRAGLEPSAGVKDRMKATVKIRINPQLRFLPMIHDIIKLNLTYNKHQTNHFFSSKIETNKHSDKHISDRQTYPQTDKQTNKPPNYKSYI